MTLWKFYTLAALLIADATTPVSATKPDDVPGWEQSRWGMSGVDLKQVFASRMLVPLPGGRAKEDLFVIPGYVFLGCPFDVSFYVATENGLNRIELTQVDGLEGHGGPGASVYRSSCAAVATQLVEQFGPAREEGDAKQWLFPSAEVTTGGGLGQVYVTFIRRAGPRSG
jgi:hypothetical protein